MRHYGSAYCDAGSRQINPDGSGGVCAAVNGHTAVAAVVAVAWVTVGTVHTQTRPRSEGIGDIG